MSRQPNGRCRPEQNGIICNKLLNVTQRFARGMPQTGSTPSQNV